MKLQDTGNFKLGNLEDRDLPDEVRDVYHHLSARQRRKLKRQDQIPMMMIRVLRMLGYLPSNMPLDQGIKVKRLLEYLSSSKINYRNSENKIKCEWLYSAITNEDFESLERWVSDVGGPQRLQSNSHSLVKRGVYKTGREEKEREKKEREKKERKQEVKLRRNGEVIN